jgi:hypothetical protein
VPLRQCVLSVPLELRLLLARDSQVQTAVGRIFVQEVFRWSASAPACPGFARQYRTLDVNQRGRAFVQYRSIDIRCHRHRLPAWCDSSAATCLQPLGIPTNQLLFPNWRRGSC